MLEAAVSRDLLDASAETFFWQLKIRQSTTDKFAYDSLCVLCTLYPCGYKQCLGGFLQFHLHVYVFEILWRSLSGEIVDSIV